MNIKQVQRQKNKERNKDRFSKQQRENKQAMQNTNTVTVKTVRRTKKQLRCCQCTGGRIIDGCKVQKR